MSEVVIPGHYYFTQLCCLAITGHTILVVQPSTRVLVTHVSKNVVQTISTTGYERNIICSFVLNFRQGLHYEDPDKSLLTNVPHTSLSYDFQGTVAKQVYQESGRVCLIKKYERQYQPGEWFIVKAKIEPTKTALMLGGDKVLKTKYNLRPATQVEGLIFATGSLPASALVLDTSNQMDHLDDLTEVSESDYRPSMSSFRTIEPDAPRLDYSDQEEGPSEEGSQ